MTIQYCVYCQRPTEHMECITEARYRQVKGGGRELASAPKYMPVCEVHVEQVANAIAEGRVVHHRPLKVRKGQISIEDYLV